jgi:AhpD family alkylhydroperoxidase
MPLAKSVLSKAHAARARLRRPPRAAASPFGGFKKRTMTAPQLVSSLASLLPELGTVYRVWFRHEIEPGFREELMLAVSRPNDCRFCTWGHHEWAQISGVSNEELAQIEQLDPSGFDRRKWVAISYVRALVQRNFKGVQPELRRAMQHKFAPQEIRQIELIARIMDIGNRGSNTYEAMLSRLRGTPAPEGRILDELVLTGAFLATAPLVLAYLSRASRRPFLEMARELIAYVGQQDKASPGGRNKP